MRLSENAHLLRYPHPSPLRRTLMYASFLGISEALHLDIFHQPLRTRFFDSLDGILKSRVEQKSLTKLFEITIHVGPRKTFRFN
jgi:hypothetical protein